MAEKTYEELLEEIAVMADELAHLDVHEDKVERIRVARYVYGRCDEIRMVAAEALRLALGEAEP